MAHGLSAPPRACQPAAPLELSEQLRVAPPRGSPAAPHLRRIVHRRLEPKVGVRLTGWECGGEGAGTATEAGWWAQVQQRAHALGGRRLDVDGLVMTIPQFLGEVRHLRYTYVTYVTYVTYFSYVTYVTYAVSAP